MLETLKTLLGVEGSELDGKLTAILNATEQRLKLLVGVSEVPKELEYIVTDVAVARFNRIGSEGLSAHSVEGESMTFVGNDFAGYMDDIQAYIDSQEEARKGRVRFL